MVERTVADTFATTTVHAESRHTDTKTPIPTTLRAFLRQNEISRDIYRLNRLGDGIVPPPNIPRRSPMLSPEDQQKLKGRIDEYRENKAKGQKRPQDNGYVWTNDFYASHNIPRYAILYYHLATGLAEKRGVRQLVTLSPEEQKIILNRWQQVLAQRERNKLSAAPKLKELTKLVVRISNLDPRTFTQLYKKQDPEVTTTVSSVLNFLTPTEQHVVSIALSELSDKMIAKRLRTSVSKVRTTKQIAVERLTMIVANSQSSQEASPTPPIVLDQKLEERFSFLANLTPNQVRTMFAKFIPKLPEYPNELSWQKIAEGLEIDTENAMTLIYLAYAQETSMSFGAFLQDERVETIPKRKMKYIFTKVFELIMEHGNLLRVFLETNETNSAWIPRQEDDIPSDQSPQNTKKTIRILNQQRVAGVKL